MSDPHERVIKRLTADVAHLNYLVLRLSERMLRAELALSVLDKDDVLRAMLYPDNNTP